MPFRDKCDFCSVFCHYVCIATLCFI
uniref:Uncharacterized protein n=1 Tax=Anguilla anguilla TaxID=7936 RepID=A0A0E9TPX9_ANGAN